MTQQHFLHEGEEEDAEAKQAGWPHTERLRRRGGFQTYPAHPGHTHHLPHWEGAEKARWILRAPFHRGAPICLHQRRWHFLLLVTFTICFRFQKWGRKFVTKEVTVLAGWERYGYEGEKWGGGGCSAEQEPEPEPCWKTFSQWPCLLAGV